MQQNVRLLHLFIKTSVIIDKTEIKSQLYYKKGIFTTSAFKSFSRTLT